MLVRPLTWWRAVDWTLEVSLLDRSTLSPEQVETTSGMYRAYFCREPNPYSQLTDGLTRVQSIASYIGKHGGLPRPPIALMIFGGLKMMDGHHRVLAWNLYPEISQSGLEMYAGGTRDSEATVWIGRKNSNHISF
jgi:hypothetical protein